MIDYRAIPSLEDMKKTREVLSQLAFLKDGAVGAIGQKDPQGIYIEAKRCVTASIQHIYGQEAWEQVLEEDAG